MIQSSNLYPPAVTVRLRRSLHIVILHSHITTFSPLLQGEFKASYASVSHHPTALCMLLSSYYSSSSHSVQLCRNRIPHSGRCVNQQNPYSNLHIPACTQTPYPSTYANPIKKSDTGIISLNVHWKNSFVIWKIHFVRKKKTN